MEKRERMHKLFQSIKDEHIEPVDGKVTGEIPDWLCGSLYKNGPGLYEVGQSKYQHLFDPLAMLSRFHIENKKVTYQNRFLNSDTYQKNTAAQRIVVYGFGTMPDPDPDKSAFQKFKDKFTVDETNDNTNVNFFTLGDELYAATETNFINRIHPQTLETIGRVELTEHAPITTTTAHPHYDADGTIHNVGLSFKGRPKVCIVKFSPKQDPSDRFPDGEVVSAIKSSGAMNVNYFHSFAMTENYYVYIEQPMFMNLLKLLTSKIRRATMSKALEWHPKVKTRFRIINRSTGEELYPDIKFEADPIMVFHHINAYEDNGHVVVDVCCVTSQDALQYVNLKDLTSETCEENWRKFSEPQARRYVIPMAINKKTPKNKNIVELDGSKAEAELTSEHTVHCTWELLADTGLDLPRINYQRFNGKKYRYVYGIGWHNEGNHFITVAKVDINTKSFKEWKEDNCYPTEPVFVPNPNGTDEDDGVVVATVNSSNFDQGQHAFLLVLDAKSMTELARVQFGIPRFPHDFHGLFIQKNV